MDAADGKPVLPASLQDAFEQCGRQPVAEFDAPEAQREDFLDQGEPVFVAAGIPARGE
ncbi:MAG: hypothetical protein WC003_12025 [Terrimicrobiaceae bacterium]